LNWAFLLLRIAIGLSILTLLFLSQRFWYRSLWRMTSNWGQVWLRVGARLAYVSILLIVIATLIEAISLGRGRIIPRASLIGVLTGLWFFSALFSYLAVKMVHGLERIWRWTRNVTASQAAVPPQTLAQAWPIPAVAETLADPGRRYFFRAATAAAG